MKRNCIFTNKPANSKFTIGSDKQNWAKSVPCTKEYLADRGDKPPTELEIRLVELFYEQELCRLRIDEYDAQMDEIRALISAGLPATKTYQKVEWPKEPVELTQEEIDWLNAPMGPLETTAEETKEALEKVGFDEIRQEIAKVEVPDGVNHYLGLKKQVEEETRATAKEFREDMAKIKKQSEELTEEEKPVKVEKKVVKKKPGNLWD